WGGRDGCHELRSAGFRRWLTRAYHDQTGLIPNVEAVKAVAAVLEAKAERDGALETAHLRVGSHGGRPYLDLCDRTRCAVEFYAGVWNLIDRSPVAFRRPEGTGALPVPQRGG